MGKARFNKNTGDVEIYEKCLNINNNHLQIDFEIFKKCYISNNYENIDMSIRLYQKYFIKCLFLYTNINTYKDELNQFNIIFKEVKFNINENIFSKIKSSVLGSYNNKTIEDVNL